jgi:hypothetical protein
METEQIKKSIEELQGLLHEIDREDYVFLTDTTTNQVIDDLLDHNGDDLNDILINGCKGFSNMTDIELIEDYKYLLKYSDKDTVKSVNEEVLYAIRQICNEQAEKALLES